MPDCAGAQSLDGYLDRCGLFVDEERPFPGPGLIVLDRGQFARPAFGLSNPAYRQSNWTVDDTREVLATLWSHWNDDHNSRSWGISFDSDRRPEQPGNR